MSTSHDISKNKVKVFLSHMAHRQLWSPFP